MIFSYMRKQLSAQGIGRHTPDEIYAMGAADLEALSIALGDELFFLGETLAALTPPFMDNCRV